MDGFTPAGGAADPAAPAGQLSPLLPNGFQSLMAGMPAMNLPAGHQAAMQPALMAGAAAGAQAYANGMHVNGLQDATTLAAAAALGRFMSPMDLSAAFAPAAGGLTIPPELWAMWGAALPAFNMAGAMQVRRRASRAAHALCRHCSTCISSSRARLLPRWYSLLPLSSRRLTVARWAQQWAPPPRPRRRRRRSRPPPRRRPRSRRLPRRRIKGSNPEVKATRPMKR